MDIQEHPWFSGGTQGVTVEEPYFLNSGTAWNPAVTIDAACDNIRIENGAVTTGVTSLATTGPTTKTVKNTQWPGDQTNHAIADDAASYIQFDGVVFYGAMLITGNIPSRGSVLLAFRVGDANAHATVLASSGATVSTDAAAAELTGTTMTNGNFNIRARTDVNRLYIENRTNGAGSYSYTLMNIVSPTAASPITAV
jgi:hypothetical protein